MCDESTNEDAGKNIKGMRKVSFSTVFKTKRCQNGGEQRKGGC